MILSEITSAESLLPKLIASLLEKDIPVFAKVSLASSDGGADVKAIVRLTRVKIDSDGDAVVYYKSPWGDSERNFDLYPDDDDLLHLVKSNDTYILRYIDPKNIITL